MPTSASISAPLPTPAQDWRERVAREARQVAAGEISAEESYVHKLFPAAFVDGTEAALRQYCRAIDACPADASGYPRVMQALKTVVLALNQLNTSCGFRAIETAEREELCDYLDRVIIARGIDIDALAASQNLGRHELGDDWREW